MEEILKIVSLRLLVINVFLWQNNFKIPFFTAGYVFFVIVIILWVSKVCVVSTVLCTPCFMFETQLIVLFNFMNMPGQSYE